MENLIKLFNDTVKECYKKMNLVALDTKRTSFDKLSQIDWEDFECGVQLIQEYAFSMISKLDKQMFNDEIRHYMYNSKLQKNIATFSLCSPDSLRYLAWTYFGGDYAKVDNRAKLSLTDITKVGIATDFSIGERLGVDLAYSSDDYLVDKMYAISETLKPLIENCNPLRLQYSMSYCGRFCRLINLFEDYFTNLAQETESVTAIILGVGAYWIRRNISYELNEMNRLMQSIARSEYPNFEDIVKVELAKFKKSHNLAPSADSIKAEILNWLK